MSKTYLNYVFDAEIFNYTWGQVPDPVLTAMITSGAVVPDPAIAAMIQSRGDIYTIPFYNVLDPAVNASNYDGQTDITVAEASSSKQTGVVYGRAVGWKRRNFSAELSGDDPMGHIVTSIAQWWNKKHQKTLIGILNAIFGISGNSDWSSHSVNIAAGGTGAVVSPDNKLGLSSARDAAVAANGANANAYSIAIMHSVAANGLAKLGQLEFWKQTDANGIQRPLNLASYNGLTVIIDDGVPVSASADVPGANEYTSYLLGNGFIRYADGKLDTPSEVERSALKNGGEDTLVTRVRRTYHPNGFSFILPASSWTESPTDAQLFASANWSLQFPAKSIAACTIISNG
jgi:hypothetical protein